MSLPVLSRAQSLPICDISLITLGQSIALAVIADVVIEMDLPFTQYPRQSQKFPSSSQ